MASASKAKKIGVSIIGLGWPGVEHLKGYRACDDCEVVALCDWDEALLAKVAGEYEVAADRTYADYREMIARDDVDAVSVCVPNYEHAELTLACLAAGKHVLCEKPPAMSPDEARAMADAAAAADRVLMYALVMRFTPETRFLKARIDAGDLGEIYLAKAGYTRRRGIPLGKDNWFVDKARSGGGAMIDIGVHALDCVWYLMGTPRPVSVSGCAYRKFAHTVPAGVKYDVDDAAMALIKFDNGASLFLEASWAWNLPAGAMKLLAGTKGGAQLDPLKIYTESDGVVLDTALAASGMPAAYSRGKTNPFHAETDHFVRVIRGTEPLLATPEHGIHLMQILTAIYSSSHTGQEVRL